MPSKMPPFSAPPWNFVSAAYYCSGKRDSWNETAALPFHSLINCDGCWCLMDVVRNLWRHATVDLRKLIGFSHTTRYFFDMPRDQFSSCLKTLLLHNNTTLCTSKIVQNYRWTSAAYVGTQFVDCVIQDQKAHIGKNPSDSLHCLLKLRVQ